DDPAPERDGADDPVDAERGCRAVSLQVGCGLLRLPRRVDAAAAVASGREVLGPPAPRQGEECTVETASDEFVPRRAGRGVDDASKAEVLALLYDEPRAPADDRLDVIGYSAHGSETFSGSTGSSMGEGASGGSAGSSRGTGSSSGSTVKVRSGSPISTTPPDYPYAASKCCACREAPQADCARKSLTLLSQ